MKYISSIFLIPLCWGNIAMPAQNPFSYDTYNALIPTEVKKPNFITSKDQLKLAYYDFLAEQPKEHAVVILYHGGGAYSTPAYQWAAEQLSQQGVSTYCFDIRGHGNSEGPRGDATSTDAVFDDIKTAIEWIKNRHQQVPLYLAGHSSGGGLLVNYHNAHKDLRVDGYILLAPFLGPLSKTARYEGFHPHSFVKKVRSWVFILNALLPVKWFHHMDTVYFNYPDSVIKSDPLYVTQYSYTMSSATTPYDINEILANWGNVPLWVFIGENDEQFFSDRVVTLCREATRQSDDAQIIPEVGHLSILKNAPELIVDCIKEALSK